MKKIQNFKLFESETEKLRIYDIEDYIVEVLDKYRSRINSWSITQCYVDPDHGDLYLSEHHIYNGQYRKKNISETAPDGCLIAYDIIIELINDSEDTPLGWDEFCDFETFNSLISDLKKSLYRLDTKQTYIQVRNKTNTHDITLSMVTKETKK